jgi:O-antigen ligase
VASIAASQLVPGGSISRSVSFLTGAGSGLSSNGRTHVWAEAWNNFLAHPLFGRGTGSFYAIDGIEHYPHNLLLEAGVELGLVGVVFVGGFLVAAFISMMRARSEQGAGDLQVAVVIALFVSALVNASFSGDIQTNSSVWLYAGLGLGLSMRSALAARSPAEPALRLDAAPGSSPGR